MARQMKQWSANSDVNLAVEFPNATSADFEPIFRTLSPLVYRVAFALCKNYQDANEVHAETFFRLWDVLADGETIRNVAGWLRRVARRVALDKLGRAHRRDISFDPALVRDKRRRRGPTLLDEVMRREKEELEHARLPKTVERIRSALATFAADERGLIVKRLQKKSYRRIEGETGQSKTALGGKLPELMARFWARLSDLGPGQEMP
jgi:RNA polymerase sigma factor (sigma-70 family)